MRKWLSGLAILALGIPAMAQDAAETKKKADSTPAKKITPSGEAKKALTREQSEGQKKFAEIQKELGKLRQEAMKEYVAAKPEDRAKLIPATQAKLDKLPIGEFAKKTVALLQSTDEKDPVVVQAIQFAAMDPGCVPEIEKLIKGYKSPSVKGNGYSILAQSQMQAAGKDGLTKEKIEELEKKAEGYFETVAKEYADVPSGRGTLGEAAKKSLFELKNLSVGKVAPEVTCLNIDGDKEDKLSNYKGKVVVLDIWATWCGPCVAMIPHEKEMVEKLKGKKFALISVSGDDKKETLVNFVEKTKMPWTHWFAERKGILQDWNIRFYPTVYILDHKGVIRAKGLRGEEMEKKVEELLAEMDNKKVS